MTRIGVLSDSHLRAADPDLTRALAQAFAGVDMILHAGDITNLSVLDCLQAPEVHAVAGNMDGPEVAARLPRKLVLQVEGKHIGLIHGWGSPFGLAGRVRAEFDQVDCLVFGHSHRPLNAVTGGVLMFNPGSVNSGLIGSGTVGILTVDQEISGKIVSLRGL